MEERPTQLNWLLASDSVTPATDMSVALVSQGKFSTQLGCAFQFIWPATGSPAGAFGYQLSSDGIHWDTGSLASADQQPTQPAGTANSTTIELPVGKWMSAWIRATYTPSGGGTGAVLVGYFTAK
jgi:hypothetical protein